MRKQKAHVLVSDGLRRSGRASRVGFGACFAHKLAGRADVWGFDGAGAAFQLGEAEVEGMAALSLGVEVGDDKT